MTADDVRGEEYEAAKPVPARTRVTGDPWVRECSQDGCARPPVARGLCSAHHKKLMKYGTPSGGRDRVYWTTDGVRATCSVDGCAGDVCAYGYCTKHYQRWKRYGDPNGPHKPNMVERFWAKVHTSGECWEWTAAVTSSGYGQVSSPRGVDRVYAHRFSAMLHFGMFDRRLLVLHHCDNRRCVNPEHLYLGDARDNARDMLERGRANNYQARQTHCKNGHEFSPANTRISKSNGQRVCRACERVRREGRVQS